MTMAELTKGAAVGIRERLITPEDTRTGLYYLYFGGLKGKIDRAYDDGSVCVEIDLESLPVPAKERHLKIQEAEQKKWLNGLSDEMRNRLNAEQKQLRISYKILVHKNDVELA